MYNTGSPFRAVTSRLRVAHMMLVSKEAKNLDPKRADPLQPGPCQRTPLRVLQGSGCLAFLSKKRRSFGTDRMFGDPHSKHPGCLAKNHVPVVVRVNLSPCAIHLPVRSKACLTRDPQVDGMIFFVVIGNGGTYYERNYT